MNFKEINKKETLPEKVFKAIKESILAGEIKAGEILPSEPVLEKQFGVSRAVIRDAIRMLKGQGLVIVKHGKGMFVSESQLEAVTDALLTSLRRDSATAWDIEQFEQILLPQVFALASEEATEEERKAIKEAAKNYISIYEKSINTKCLSKDSVLSEAMDSFATFLRLVLISTHNKVIALLGDVLIGIRKFRFIPNDADQSFNNLKIINLEKNIIDKYIEAIEVKNGKIASQTISEAIKIKSSIISILKETPIGSSPHIPQELLLE